MDVEVWLQDYPRGGGMVGEVTGPGPVASRRDVVEHFRDGRYSRLDSYHAGPGATPIDAAMAAWRRFAGDLRPGDVLVATRGGTGARAAFVLMREEGGCRLQKVDLEAESSCEGRGATVTA